MIPFDQIDERLEKLGKDRKWLAQATGRSAGAIGAALAPNSVPKNRTALLQKALTDAIEKEEANQGGPAALALNGVFNIVQTPEQALRTDLASRAVNAASISDFCLQAIRFRTDEILERNVDPCGEKILSALRSVVEPPNLAPFPDSRVADVEAEYKVSTPPPRVLAAAGSPITCDEVLDWNGDADTVLVRICGLSMEPLLHDGDEVVMRHKRVSRSPFMKKGLIYLVAYDGGFTVKRYNTRPARPEEKGEEWAEKGKVKVLESINPDFREIIIRQPIEWVAWMDDWAHNADVDARRDGASNQTGG